jgi:hypothetical protein
MDSVKHRPIYITGPHAGGVHTLERPVPKESADPVPVFDFAATAHDQSGAPHDRIAPIYGLTIALVFSVAVYYGLYRLGAAVFGLLG